MTQFAAATFAGTSGATLQASDANWAKVTAAGTDLLLTNANRVRSNAGNLTGVYYHTATPPQADYSVTGYVYNAGSVASGAGVCARMSDSVETYYLATISTSSNKLQLYRFTTGTAQLLGEMALTMTVGVTKKIRLDVIGSIQSVYLDDSTDPVVGGTDTAITTTGYAGVRVRSTASTSDTTGVHLGNWSASTPSSGVTQVTGDLGVVYNVRSGTGQDLAASYSVRTSVTASIAPSYNIRASTIQDLSAAYVLRNVAQADMSPSYNVRGMVVRDGLAAYNLRNAVSADLTSGYSIVNAGTVTSDLVAAYGVRAGVQSDASVAYELRGAVQSSLAPIYALRSAVVADLAAIYAVVGGAVSVSSDLICSYSVFGMPVRPLSGIRPGVWVSRGLSARVRPQRLAATVFKGTS